MQAVAKLKNSAHSPRKMRLVADIVRGLPIEKALYILKHHPKKEYCKEMEKLLLSAIANWQEKYQDRASVEESELYIREVKVDGARALKRIQPAPQGRAHRIKKRFNHITLIVASAIEHELAEEIEEEEVEEIEEIETEEVETEDVGNEEMVAESDEDNKK